MSKKIISYVMIILVALISACGDSTSDPSSSVISPPRTTPTSALKTTLLVYIEGTNLEDGLTCRDDAGKTVYCSSATNNIYEMLKAASSDKLNVVLTTGAANKAVASEPVDDWRKVRRYVIQNKKLVEIGTGAVKDMGDPAVLTDFIQWGQKAYPADRYMIVFWDHGGGALRGFGGHAENVIPRPVYAASNLTVAQLKAAVADAVGNDVAKQFELIGFDACLMATLEVADAFRGVARYLVASEEIEPGAGWDWTVFLDYLVANPGASGAKVGQVIADGYKNKTLKNEMMAAKMLTLSVLDLSKIRALIDALSAFASEQSQALAQSTTAADTWFRLATNRSLALDFSTTWGKVGSFDEVDLGGMVLRGEFQTPAGQALSKLLESKEYVTYSVNGDDRADATGLSIYFPTANVFHAGSEADYEDLKLVSPEYRGLIKTYSAYARDKVPDLTFGNVSVAGSVLSTRITTDKPRYEQVFVAIKRTGVEGLGEYYSAHQPIWSTSADAADFSYPVTTKWLTVNGKLASLVADHVTEKGPTIIKIPVWDVEKDGTCSTSDDAYGTLYFRYDFNEGPDQRPTEFLGISNDVNNAIGRLVMPRAGDKIFLQQVSMIDGKAVWKCFAEADYLLTVPADGMLSLQRSVTPTGKDVAFFGYDLRWKPFVSQAVTLN